MNTEGVVVRNFLDQAHKYPVLVGLILNLGSKTVNVWKNLSWDESTTNL